MELLDALDLILEERALSIEKHGDWHDYTLEQMMAVIINELMVEAGDAERAGDLHGEHGVVRELAQVANCCIKAIMVLSDRTDATLAGTVRTDCANPGIEGCALPASLSHPQGEESCSNSPTGVAA